MEHLTFAGFQNDHFDFCILDVMLPKMDGFTLARKMKILNTQIPIIFLTARSLKKDKMKRYEIGVDDYITKTFDEYPNSGNISAPTSRLASIIFRK